MARELDVYLNNQLAGRLVQDNTGEIQYRYDESWLANPRAIALSQSLPLKREPFARAECQGFFGGLLPEGENREIIARNLGITARNDVKMLEQIGGECAGAIAFFPAGESPPSLEPSYRPVSAPELADILRRLPRRPLLAGEDRVRLSLAGAQNKLAVCVTGGQISLPLDGAPSTHILKPAIQNYADIVLNEGMCLKLARDIGLPVANATQGSVEGIEYLLIERYDRIRGGNGALERLHQEDFCQALGIASENKYQNEGGPSLAQCFQLLRNASSVPARDVVRLLDAVIFNYLIGNNDAHGKNFSLFYQANAERVWETSLTPLYDLICTACYPDISTRMAMKIGGEYRPEKIQVWHFEKFASECGLSFPLMRRRIQWVIRRVLAQLPAVAGEDPAVLPIVAVIRERCDRTSKLFHAAFAADAQV